MSSYNYWCPFRSSTDNCEHCTPKGAIVLSSELSFSEQEKEELICPNKEDEQLKLMGENTFTHVGEKSNGRPIKEAKERSSKQFRREILPTLTGTDRAHFNKKYKIKDQKKKKL